MRRWFKQCCVAATMIIGCTSGPLHAETRALLAATWNFNSPQIKDLQGPPNDLAAMESLIRGQGATDVTVLRNDGMTRTTFETALHALGLRSKPGDWIFIYYSGHGAEADAAVKGTADGDSDQFLPLANFSGSDPERYIIDKDFYAWISRYVPRSVQVFMMADVCHSGTLHRSIDPRARSFTSRLALRAGEWDGKLSARPAPRFPSVLADVDNRDIAIQRAELPNEIFIGAAQDDEVAGESPMPVAGQPARGWLTWAFEHGMTETGPDGRTLLADTNHDGKVSVGEIAQYLNTQVRMISGQQQSPSAHYISSLDKTPLFETIVRPTVALVPPKFLPGVFISGKGPVGLVPDGYRLVARADGADFVWDIGAGQVIRGTGDIVAEKIGTGGALAAVIEKWAAIGALRSALSEAGGHVTIGPAANGTRYHAGDRVRISLDAAPTAGTRYVTVFDLASDGTVQRLYPLDADGDGRVLPGERLSVFDSRVVAPFGTDHVIALLTASPPGAVRDLLRTADNQRAAARIVPTLRAALAIGGAGASLSIGELYTGE